MPKTKKILRSFNPESLAKGGKMARPVYFRTYMLAEYALSGYHYHPFIQFHYAREGWLYVSVEDHSYIIPACYGLWVPAYTPHQIQTTSDVLLENLDIDPDYFASIGGKAELKLVTVSDFARSFIHHASQNIPELYDVSGSDGRMITTLLDVLNALPVSGISTTWPTSPALLAMCKQITTTLDQPHLLEEWAKQVGMSPRTFSRHFLKETGVTFANWKQQQRLLHSIQLLRESRSVTEIALMLGYSSTSAYSYAFRQLFGVSPSRYEAALLPPEVALDDFPSAASEA
ncbi:helix-turn-helix transcriptional regulator [Citrobacter sp. Marseille-Q6884]|uniref:helix-turn-helix transcriptional regulator n=1 Tax=Citrobacter sp. Marseille-Q6884 TaxID=2956786 RepID=UPI0021B3ED1D|nr:AraC family transcriptional regulator [Citrobacter sp. Marseille-Q6884]